METKELMIGDWVEDIIPVVIDAISNEDICTYRSDFGYITANPSNLKPIPLTAEILEKNGFEGDKEVMQYHFTEDGQKYHFSLRQMYNKDNNPQGYSFFAFHVLTIIDYVHQLQHALRLCGIDKTIEL